MVFHVVGHKPDLARRETTAIRRLALRARGDAKQVKGQQFGQCLGVSRDVVRRIGHQGVEAQHDPAQHLIFEFNPRRQLREIG
jgi:hypothetical protein